MKTIKFEMTDKDPASFHNPIHAYYAEISLGGDRLEDYLQAFKAFLVTCSFTEETISEIQTKEQFYLDSQKDLTNNN